jgi:purine-binding chemotaxis protein CheW
VEDLIRQGDEEEIQLVVFQLGREEYAIEVSQVREILSMVEATRMPNAPAYMKGVINLRGQILAVIDLGERLRIESGEGDRRIIVVEVGENRAGMIVDYVSEVLRVPMSSVEGSPVFSAEAEAGMIKGVIKLQNRLLILLNAALVLSAVENWQETSEADVQTAASDSE